MRRAKDTWCGQVSQGRPCTHAHLPSSLKRARASQNCCGSRKFATGATTLSITASPLTWLCLLFQADSLWRSCFGNFAIYISYCDSFARTSVTDRNSQCPLMPHREHTLSAPQQLQQEPICDRAPSCCVPSTVAFALGSRCVATCPGATGTVPVNCKRAGFMFSEVADILFSVCCAALFMFGDSMKRGPSPVKGRTKTYDSVHVTRK